MARRPSVMKKTPKKPNDFLVRCLERGYSEQEIIKAFCEIRTHNSDKLLRYFMSSRKSDNPEVKGLARKLSSALGNPDFMWRNFNYLARCQRSQNKDVSNLATELVQYAMRFRGDKEKIEKLEYFISCQKARSKKVRKLANSLANDISSGEFAKKIDILIGYSQDKNRHVRKFVRKYAIKSLRERNLPAEEIEKRFDFIMTCSTEPESSAIFGDARTLSLDVMKKWPVEKLTPYLDYLILCNDEGDGDTPWVAMELVMKIMATWPYQKRKEKLDYFLSCWRRRGYYDHQTYKMSLGLILGIIRYFKGVELAKHINVLIDCQDIAELRQLSRRLALKISNEDLIIYGHIVTRNIDNINNFSNSHKISLLLELKLKMMSDWDSEKLGKNLWYLFACHNSPNTRLQAKAKKLVLSIKPEDLSGKAGEIIHLAFSSSLNACLLRNMELGLCFPINPDEFLTCLPKLLEDHCDIKKYHFLKAIAFRIDPEKFNLKDLFRLDSHFHFHLGGLLAVRAMKKWKVNDLKIYKDDIFTFIHVDGNKELNELAELLYNKIKVKEFDPRRISRIKRMIIG